MYTSSTLRQILDRHEESMALIPPLNCTSYYIESVGLGSFYRDGTEAKNHIAHFLYEDGTHKTCEAKKTKLIWSIIPNF